MYSNGNGNVIKKFERNIFTESITITPEDENKLTKQNSNINLNSNSNSRKKSSQSNTISIEEKEKENNLDQNIEINQNQIEINTNNNIITNFNQNNLEKILLNPNLNLSSASVKKYKQLESILNLKIINLSELRSISWNGLPFGKFLITLIY